MNYELHEKKWRWVTGDSIERLRAALGSLPPDTTDWELIYPFPGRIDEFFDYYERTSMSDDDAFALMALIVCSVNERLDKEADCSAQVARLRRLLETHYPLHEATIHYWCAWDHEDPEDETPDHMFPISPLMREIWRTHQK